MIVPCKTQGGRYQIRQETTEKIKEIDTKISHLSEIMEHAYTVTKYREIYKYHRGNLNDKNFENEYSGELALNKVTATEILKH